MMWEAAARKTREQGGDILLGHQVTSLRYDNESELWSVGCSKEDGSKITIGGTHVISSAPIKHLAATLSTELSENSLLSATSLRYRDFLVVALILLDRHLFDDNWIYIHDPSVKVGRVQNFKSWSPEMVPDQSMCCYGLEYFCFEGDGLWVNSDDALIELAKTELIKLGLAHDGDIIDGSVVRQAKAYPVYDADYSLHVENVRREIELRFPTLNLVGRNGMHKYNNQDHAMMTSMLTVKNILAGKRIYNVWRVNQDAEYHESDPDGQEDIESALSGGLRSVPTPVKIKQSRPD
jgi:protoporphyrinogen oxidase